MLKEGDAQRLRLYAVGILTNCPPGTEAKFITKSLLVVLLLGDFRLPTMKPGFAPLMIVIPSSPNCTKPFVVRSLFFLIRVFNS